MHLHRLHLEVGMASAIRTSQCQRSAPLGGQQAFKRLIVGMLSRRREMENTVTPPVHSNPGSRPVPPNAETCKWGDSVLSAPEVKRCQTTKMHHRSGAASPRPPGRRHCQPQPAQHTSQAELANGEWLISSAPAARGEWAVCVRRTSCVKRSSQVTVRVYEDAVHPQRRRGDRGGAPLPGRRRAAARARDSAPAGA